MSSQKSTNYNLHKWLGTDDVVREEFNENTDILDNKVKEVDTKAEENKVAVIEINRQITAGEIGAAPEDTTISTETSYSSQKTEDTYAKLNHTHTEYSPVDHTHDEEYAPILHNHDTDYATIDHTHTEFTTIQEQILNMDMTGYEKRIDSLATLPVATSADLGKRFLIQGQLVEVAVIGQSASATMAANRQYATKEELTADGLEILEVNPQTVGKEFYPFDTDISTETLRYESKVTGVYASTGKIGLKFPTTKQFVGLNYKTNYAWYPSKYAVETSLDGITWTEQKLVVNSNGGLNYPSTPAVVDIAVSFPMVEATHIRLVSYLKGNTSIGTEATPSRIYVYDFQAIENDPNALEYGYKEIGYAGRGVSIVSYGASVDLEDNSPAIQKALDKNAKVYVPDGIFKVQQSIKVPSNTHLQMSRGAEIRRNADIKSIFINKSTGTIGGYDANENILIEGGTINGNYSAFAAGTAREFGQVVFAHTKNSVIRNVKFKGQDRWHMIEINSSFNILVEGCKFNDYIYTDANATEAIQIDSAISTAQLPMTEGAPYDETMCANITIRNCEFENVYHAIGSHSSVVGKLHRKIRVEGCYFKNLTGYMVKGLNWEDVDVEHNLVEGAKYGVLLELNGTKSSRIRVANNRLFSIGVSAGVYDDIGRAIQITSAATGLGVFERIIIESNFISLVGRYGVGFDYGVDVLVKNNSIQSVWRSGMWSYGAKKVIISENIVGGTNVGAFANTQSIKIGNNVALGDKGIVCANNRVDTISIDNTDNCAFIYNIVNASGITLPATNTNFQNVGNISF